MLSQGRDSVFETDNFLEKISICLENQANVFKFWTDGLVSGWYFDWSWLRKKTITHIDVAVFD